MRAFLILIAFCSLNIGCKPSAMEVSNSANKIEGIYKIKAILTNGKTLSQTNATLQISLIPAATNQARFIVTYVSESGKTMVDEVETRIEMITGDVLFYDVNHYPTSRFAIWNQNTINCTPLVGQGPSVGFYAEK